MIDFECFENYVKARCENVKFIFCEKLISHADVVKIRNLISSYKSTEVLKCIASTDLAGKFYVETKCDQCSALSKERLSKTKFVEYINEQMRKNRKKSWRNCDYICAACETENKNRIEESRKKIVMENQIAIQKNTIYYIENYLNTNMAWSTETTPKQRINMIIHTNVNWEAISEHITGMDYQEFLNTPYWKAIAAHTKYKAGYRCQVCDKRENLATHHRNYDIHGREHAHMQELTVLCDDCHSKFHDIEK